ncbi:MAG: aminotransferase class IV [Bacteroidota bacterium]|nr:aminotransferase class IV [Bacteroidota bacterium]
MAESSAKTKQIVWQHKLMPVSQFDAELISNLSMIYEVLRIIDGKFVFLKDHLIRLKKSLILAEINLPFDESLLLQDMNACVSENQVRNGNIRVSLFPDKEKIHVLCEIVSHHYPTVEDYQNGVAVAFTHFVRTNPNVKKWNASMKAVVARYKAMRKVYEVLLYNENSLLTEGSQSNLFFIVDKTVVTAPDDLVLKGITRDYVIKTIIEAGFQIKYQAVNVVDVLNYDAAFITGTSSKVLPIRKIVSCCHANVNHPVLQRIMRDYDLQIKKNLSQ